MQIRGLDGGAPNQTLSFRLRSPALSDIFFEPMGNDLERLKAALSDRYRVERELGQGGMATVYLATDVKHERQVAIKVMRPEIAAALGGDRFLREIQLAARLQHPHILMLIDSGDADGLLYYVMPYVAGESLATRLAREKQLSLEDAVQITREVASALRHAHEEGVIHRDIKPDNILLSGGHAMVMDFGIGRALSAAGADKLTSTGLAVGTPAYMSPEQASAAEVDGRTDVYALGCVLYEMLVGEPPYTGATPQAIIAKSYADPVPSARRVRHTISAELDAVVTKALAKVPADRFASSQQFAEALTLQLGTPAAGIEIAEPRVPAPSRGPLLTKARWRPVEAVGVAAVALVVVLGVWFGRWTRSPDEAVADRIALAVLPFENLGAADDEYFADGMTEEVSARLARLSGLSVIGPASAGRFADSAIGERAIGRRLGVEYLLTGTVRWARAPDGTSRVKVTPRLVQASDESQVWGEPYEAELTDVFALQASLAERVAQAMDVTLLSSEETAVRAAPTVSQEAYQEYSLGRFHHARNDGATAIEHLRRAVDLDPNYARAYAGLADAYHHALGATDQGGLLTEKMDLWARAEQAARRALALDSTLGAAYVSLGYVQMSRDLDWSRAEANFVRGLTFDPAYAYGHSRYSFLLFAIGQVDSAIAEGQRAVALDPLNPQYHRGVAIPLAAAGRPGEAIEAANRALALDQVTGRPQRTLAAVYISQQDWDAARDEIPKAGFPPDVAQLWYDAVTDPAKKPALMGYLDRASVLVERFPAAVAVLLTWVGEHDRAIQLLEQAVADRTFDSVMQLKASPLFDPLRGQPKFESLLRRMGLG